MTMRSYLEACGVPTTRIGTVEVPRLIMGIHPYDGCSYQTRERDAEVLRTFDRTSKLAEVLRFAVEGAGITAVQVDHMAPALNRMHLQAVWEASQDTGIEIGLVAYILIPVMLDGEMVAYSEREHSTFYAHNERVAGEAFAEHFRNDEIVRYVLSGPSKGLATPDRVEPFTPEEMGRLEIDYGMLERHLGFFEGLDILVADAGAEIDLLAMTGRFDLIHEYLELLRGRFRTVVTSVHHAGITIPLLEENAVPVDGYVTTVNRPGTFMFPTPDRALDAIQSARKPVIAIKPMAGGRCLGRQAFEYVFDEMGVAAAMFGMGTLDQVRETTAAAREVLGAI